MPPARPATPEPVASPCVGHCTLDPQSVCLGCGRHIDEIIAWPSSNEARRRQIRTQADARQRARQTAP